jgi:predicted nucleic acid-binding protein
VIFIDSNVPMYLVGAPHPHKTDAQRLLERAVLDRRRLVTSAQVLQEILHRYAAIQRRDAIDPTFDLLLGVVDVVLPVTVDDVSDARALVVEHRELSARDALHAALMRRHGIETILSFDRGFDAIDGLHRLR